MDLMHGLILVTVVHLLAAASPGPDFVMVSQLTLTKGRKAGLLCSIGIALGLGVHITYSAFGLATVIAGSAYLLTILKWVGGSYLIYLGIKGLRSKPGGLDVQAAPCAPMESPRKMIGRGFICNTFNPKAPIYFVSLFTVVLSPDMPVTHLLVYGVWIIILQFLWFSFVATVLGSGPVARRFNRVGHYIDRVSGGVMIALGIKVISSEAAKG
ncbi:MAG: LysE family translocator [Pseudodesulfovibrio sp.]|uniref:LysE family translocator n=1 Tax=Pseudodesulfovibrio sp. TaxID=2035812 RepID=UPI003D0CA2A3